MRSVVPPHHLGFFAIFMIKFHTYFCARISSNYSFIKNIASKNVKTRGKFMTSLESGIFKHGLNVPFELNSLILLT